MMKKMALFVFFIIINYSLFLFADDTNNDDWGLFINGTKNDGYGGYVEKEFTHPVSGKKIYYEGANEKGEGQYFIYDRGNKKIILKTHFRYGPWIKWYGEYLVGIVVASANIPSLIFFDLENNTLSEQYSFYIYVDEHYNSVICIEDGCLTLYDIKTNKTLKEFVFDAHLIFDHFDEELGIDLYYRHFFDQAALSSCGKFDIQKINKETLIIKYEIDDWVMEQKGEFVYRY